MPDEATIEAPKPKYLAICYSCKENEGVYLESETKARTWTCSVCKRLKIESKKISRHVSEIAQTVSDEQAKAIVKGMGDSKCRYHGDIDDCTCEVCDRCGFYWWGCQCRTERKRQWVDSLFRKYDKLLNNRKLPETSIASLNNLRERATHRRDTFNEFDWQTADVHNLLDVTDLMDADDDEHEY